MVCIRGFDNLAKYHLKQPPPSLGLFRRSSGGKGKKMMYDGALWSNLKLSMFIAAILTHALIKGMPDFISP